MRTRNLIWLIALFFGLTAFIMPELLVLDAGLDGCPRPSDVVTEEITDTSVTVSWIIAGDVDSAFIEIRQAGSSDWSASGSVSSPFIIDTLTPCTEYEIRMFSMCENEVSGSGFIQTFETDSCCQTPSSLSVMMVEETLATLGWDDVAEVDSFILRYRYTGASSWQNIVTAGTGYVLVGLQGCSSYKAQVAGICESGDTTEFSEPVNILTAGCGTCTEQDYCDSRGIDAEDIWIDSISFGNLFMATGFNSGYLGYTTEKLILERGRTYRLFAAPGFAADTCPLIFRAWIDLDLDGSFNDSTELVLDSIDYTGSGVGATVSLADTLALDFTRLRVSMQPWLDGDTLRTSPCDIFNFGEVEDYCVKIDDVCPIAENLDTVSVSQTGALISWDSNDKAIGFYYQYRPVGNSDWEGPEIILDTIVQLSDLDKCKAYEFELIQVCIQDTTHQLLRFDTKCSSSVNDPESMLTAWLAYPNPFGSSVTLEMESRYSIDGRLSVFSSTGQMITERRIILEPGLRATETISEMADREPGIYFAILTDGRQSSVIKLVKMN